MADDADLSMTVNADDLRPSRDDEKEFEGNGHPNDAPTNPEDVSPADFAALNSQMDELNNALDVLEEQNDVIHAKLIELLESNRAARQQFKEEQEKRTDSRESQ